MMDLISLSVITEKSAVIPYGAFHPNELWVEPWGPEGHESKEGRGPPFGTLPFFGETNWKSPSTRPG